MDGGHDSIRVTLSDDGGAESQRTGRPASGGLHDDVLGWQRRGVLPQLVSMGRFGQDQRPLGRDDESESTQGVLNQRLVTRERQELFGTGRSAQRPETRPASSGQYGDEIVLGL